MSTTFCKTREREEEKKKKKKKRGVHSLTLTLTLNHLANELLRMATMLYVLTYSSVTEYNYLRCTMDYKQLLK